MKDACISNQNLAQMLHPGPHQALALPPAPPPRAPAQVQAVREQRQKKRYVWHRITNLDASTSEAKIKAPQVRTRSRAPAASRARAY